MTSLSLPYPWPPNLLVEMHHDSHDQHGLCQDPKFHVDVVGLYVLNPQDNWVAGCCAKPAAILVYFRSLWRVLA